MAKKVETPNVRQILYGGIGGLKELNENCVLQYKDDGSHYLLHIANDKAYALTSKRESVKTAELCDKFLNFPKLQTEVFPFKKETILVVEVSAQHLNIPQSKKRRHVTEIMGCSPERIIGNGYLDTEDRENDLCMLVHDVIYLEGVDVANSNYKNRYDIVTRFFPSAGQYGERMNESGLCWSVKNIKPQEFANKFKLTSLEEFQDIKNIVDSDVFPQEGVIVKELTSNRMAKIKKIRTADCIITGYTEGKGKYTGQVGALIVSCFEQTEKELKALKKIKFESKNHLSYDEVTQAGDNLIVCGVLAGISDEVRIMLSENKDHYIGEVIEVKYMEWTGKKMFQPRFSQFRDDKDIKRCTMEQFEEV